MHKKELEWEYKRLKCVVIALDQGHRCGYVNVPEGNRFYRLKYKDQVPNAKINLNRPRGESFTILINLICGNKEELEKFTCTLDGIIEIHGGLTYSKDYLLFCENGWWIGFDCSHCDDGKDLSLIDDPFLKKLFDKQFYTSREGLTIWNLDMVKAETEKLAEQVYNQIGNYEKEWPDDDCKS